jgi:hypothetical protein
MRPGVTNYCPSYEAGHFPLACLAGIYNPLEHNSEQVFKIEIEDVFPRKKNA